MKRKNIIIIIAVSVIALMLMLYAGLKIYSANVAERAVNEVVAGSSGFVNIRYRKVSVDLFAMDLKISDVVISPPGTPRGSDQEIKIRQLVIHEIDQNPGIPRFLSFSARGIDIDMYEFEQPLAEMGYDKKILFDLSFDYRYDNMKKEFNINKFSLGADKAGEVNVSLNLGNVDLEPDQIFYTIFNYPEILLQNAVVSYIDNSLAERLIAFEASLNDQSISDYKMFLDREIELKIEEEADLTVRDALTAFRTFINNPDKISAVIVPQRPVPVGMIIIAPGLPELAGLLNIKFNR